MRVLLTGAFGNIGENTQRELLVAGHEVRCFDRATPPTRKRARAMRGRVDIVWGDICDPGAVARAMEGQEAVIHNAAVLPPRSEREPTLTRRVNVEGTRNVLTACTAQPQTPLLVFASSISVHGHAQHRPPPRCADEPLEPTDHYSRSKAECEAMIRGSDVPWIILRFAAAPPEDPNRWERGDLADMFRIDPNTRIEYLSPRDAALAQARAVSTPVAVGRVLMIGGGKSCQVRMREFNGAYLEAAGIGVFPDQAYGSSPFYTDWMNTDESQKLLGYQRYSFEDLRRERWRQMRVMRTLIRPVRGLVRRRMLRSSQLSDSARR